MPGNLCLQEPEHWYSGPHAVLDQKQANHPFGRVGQGGGIRLELPPPPPQTTPDAPPMAPLIANVVCVVPANHRPNGQWMGTLMWVCSRAAGQAACHRVLREGAGQTMWQSMALGRTFRTGLEVLQCSRAPLERSPVTRGCSVAEYPWLPGPLRGCRALHASWALHDARRRRWRGVWEGASRAVQG